MVTGIKCDECGLPEVVDIHKKPGHYFHKFVPSRPRTDEEGALRNGGGEVNELSARSKELRSQLGIGFSALVSAIVSRELDEQERLEAKLVSHIEQALLAERRLAMEEAAKMALDSMQGMDERYGAEIAAQSIRAAAEKEVR